MTSPDDLPEDPFGESGMAQVFCGGCGGDRFHFVYTAATVRAICPSHQPPRIEGEWPRRGVDTKPVAPDDGMPRSPWNRDMLQPPSGPPLLPPPSGAAWMGEIQQEPSLLPPPSAQGPQWQPSGHQTYDPALWGSEGGEPPPLPHFSAGICNVYLDGGPYDGQITNLMAGATDFQVRGVPGRWVATPQVKDGRIVYTWQPPAGGTG